MASGGLDLTCVENCADATFDHVWLNVTLAAIPWAAFTVIGMLAGQLFPVTVKSARIRLSVYEYGLTSSGMSSAYAVIFASVGQCVMFFYRAGNRSIDSTQHGLEMIAAMIAIADVIANWMFVVTQGPLAVFWYAVDGRLMSGMLVTTSVVAVAMSPPGLPQSWFSFTFLSSYRLMSVVEYFEIQNMTTNKVSWKRTVTLKILSVVLYVYCAAGVIMTLELAGSPQRDEWSVWGSMVFVFSTVSTVGNSPLMPQSVAGRIMAIGLTFWGIQFTYSQLIPNVNSILLDANIGIGEYTPKKNGRKHVVLCGSPGSRMIRDFLDEIYHENHFEGIHDFDVSSVDLVVLVPNEETLLQVRVLLRRRQCLLYRARIKLLKGEAYNVKDLERASARKALCAYVLPNLVVADVVSDDKANIMRALALGTHAPMVHTTCLLHRAEHRPGTLEVEGSDLHFISIDAFKLSLLAKGCLTRGAMAMVLNLCRSTGEYNTNKNARAWQGDYQHSVGGELYEDELSPHYDGCSFGDVLLDVLARSSMGDVLLIGVVEEDSTGTRVVHIHPGMDYELNYANKTFYGVFIAPDIGKIKQMGDKSSDAAWAAHQAVMSCDSPRRERRRKEASRVSEIVLADTTMSLEEQLAIAEAERSKGRLTAEQIEQQYAATKYDEAMCVVQRRMMLSGIDIDTIGGIADGLRAEADSLVAMMAPTTEVKEVVVAPIKRKRPPKRPVVLNKSSLLYSEIEGQLASMQLLNWQKDMMLHTAKHGNEPLPDSIFGDHLLLCIVSDTTSSVDHLRASARGLGPPIGIEYFMQPLRDSRTSGSAFQPTVVVLADVLPCDWHTVVELPRVYFVRGSPLRLHDLNRAHFKRARAVAIARGHLGGHEDCTNVADANVLVATSLIEENMPGTSQMPVVVDLSFDGSCNFLPKSKVTIEPADTAPATTLPKVLKSLGQAFSGPSNDREVPLDDFSPEPPEENYEDLPWIDYAFHYRFMTGQVFIASAMMSFVANSFYNPSLVQLVSALLNAPLLLLPLPSVWERRSYADLAAWMLKKRNLLALGIFRSAHAAEAGIGKNLEETLPSHHYIFTAPPAFATLVVKTDQILCLAPTPPPVPEDDF
eukprot:TRINITY_DN71823_c0_g1_i1.p1 TRINITY_DN71823_c0_g1~~TRINITY_DN71823_c0_g1_i1.p1  ORF type:complete len:1109 (+),score=229.92 TRINITY_DN71823_c0_g1_i1:115-3441(+)